MTAVRNAALPMRRLVCVAGALLAASTTAASAQTTTTTSTGPTTAVHFGQPGSPIDISAKHTDVFQNEQRIVYDGEVEVLQGQDRLRTPRLTMWYNNKNGVKGAAGAASSNGGVGAIDRMDAEGPVFFVTPTQSARGDHGNYTAADDTITLVGNVILTQDKNVSTGDKLVIHQKTGLATLSSERSSGRVRGVFYNEDKNKPAAASPAAPASGPSTSAPAR